MDKDDSKDSLDGQFDISRIVYMLGFIYYLEYLKRSRIGSFKTLVSDLLTPARIYVTIRFVRWALVTCTR